MYITLLLDGRNENPSHYPCRPVLCCASLAHIPRHVRKAENERPEMKSSKWEFTEWDSPMKTVDFISWLFWYKVEGKRGSFRVFGFRWNK